MTSTMRRTTGARRVYFHDPDAPRPALVVPSAFVAARRPDGAILLVRRCDSGTWELPGGRVDVGESAPQAAVREAAEEAGVAVRVTGLLGVHSDPAEVVQAADGEVRQQFVVVFRAEVVDGSPRPDGLETDAAAWVEPEDVAALAVEPATRIRIVDALAAGAPPLAVPRQALPGRAPAVLRPRPVTCWTDQVLDLLRAEIGGAVQRGSISTGEAEQLLARVGLVIDQALAGG